MSHDRRAALLVLGAGTLAGCAVTRDLIRPTPPQIYRLSPTEALEEGLPPVAGTLLVETPTAVAGLNTARIALRPEPSKLDFYANALWVTVLPVMFGNLVAETLGLSGRIEVTTPDYTSGVRPDYSLNLAIIAFEAVYDGGTDVPPLVTLRVGARLLRLPKRAPIAGSVFKEVARSDGTAMPAIVAAFDAAADRLLADVAAWSLRQLAAATA